MVFKSKHQAQISLLTPNVQVQLSTQWSPEWVTGISCLTCITQSSSATSPGTGLLFSSGLSYGEIIFHQKISSFPFLNTSLKLAHRIWGNTLSKLCLRKSRLEKLEEAKENGTVTMGFRDTHLVPFLLLPPRCRYIENFWRLLNNVQPLLCPDLTWTVPDESNNCC